MVPIRATPENQNNNLQDYKSENSINVEEQINEIKHDNEFNFNQKVATFLRDLEESQGSGGQEKEKKIENI